MQRPTGVKILAILAAIVGVVLLCVTLGAIGLGGFLSGVLGARAGVRAGLLGEVVGIVIGGITFIIALFELAFAYGAWNLKPWAWLLGIVAQGIGGVLAFIRLIDGRGNVGTEVATIVISAIIIYYLMTPEVKRAFGRP